MWLRCRYGLKHSNRSTGAASDDALWDILKRERDNLYGCKVDEQSFDDHTAKSTLLRKATGRKLVLVREDNLLNVRLIRDLLECFMRCHVIIDMGGSKAFQLACEHQPDLIHSDIQSPYESGLDFAQKLRSDQRTAEIPLLCVSSFILKGELPKIYEAALMSLWVSPLGYHSTCTGSTSYYKEEGPAQPWLHEGLPWEPDIRCTF